VQVARRPDLPLIGERFIERGCLNLVAVDQDRLLSSYYHQHQNRTKTYHCAKEEGRPRAAPLALSVVFDP
jgi:hypothetical protein